jgi:hypothetical protein
MAFMISNQTTLFDVVFVCVLMVANAGYGNLRKKLKPLKFALARHAK